MLELAQVQRCIHALESSDEESRRETIHFLKGVDADAWSSIPRKALPPLVQVLQRLLESGSKSLPTRNEIIVILGQIGSPAGSAIPQLAALLADGNADAVREAAATALGRMGSDARSAIDPLSNLLTHSRTSLAIQALRALVLIGGRDERVATALTELWQLPTLALNVRIELAIAMCKSKIDSGDALAFLTWTAAVNPAASERRAAVGALAFCSRHQPEVATVLVRAALSDKDEEVRKVADASLAQLRLTRAKALEICARQLALSAHAEAALKHGGEHAVPALMDALDAGDPGVKEKAARLLGCLGEVALPAVKPLTQALRDADPMLRLAAAKAIWNITSDAKLVTPALVALLEEDYPPAAAGAEERRRHLQTIIEALWRIGPGAKSAIPALTAKSKDKNRLVSESALSALRAIAQAPAPAAH